LGCSDWRFWPAARVRGRQSAVTRAIQQAEKLWGPAANWTPRQKEVFNGLEQVARTEEAQKSAQSAAAWTAIGQGLQQAGAQIAGAQTDPFILSKLNNRQPTTQFRSWHNSDGSSGQYVPYPGGDGGTVFQSNGTTGQYVPYPGGNGGAIFNSDGTITNIDPAIGQ
jgi:hypothetical protein